MTAAAAMGCAVRDGGLETITSCGRAGASGACTLYEFGMIVVPGGMRLLLQVATTVALMLWRIPSSHTPSNKCTRAGTVLHGRDLDRRRSDCLLGVNNLADA